MEHRGAGNHYRGVFDRFVDSAEVYDPATNAWSAAPALGGLKRYGAKAFCRGGQLLLLGGVRQEMGPGSALGGSYNTPCVMLENM